MNSARGYRSNCNQKTRPMKYSPTIGLNRDSVLIIRLPDWKILGVISKSLFLTMCILALPSIGSYINKSSEEKPGNDILQMVFKDLVSEGVLVLKQGQKGLVLSSGIGDLFDGFWVLNEKGIDVVGDLDLDRQMVIPDEVFDFVLVSDLDLDCGEFINRVVKIDGVVVMPFGNGDDRCYGFLKELDYRIVYVRQFDSVTVIAMRKIDDGED